MQPFALPVLLCIMPRLLCSHVEPPHIFNGGTFCFALIDVFLGFLPLVLYGYLFADCRGEARLPRVLQLALAVCRGDAGFARVSQQAFSFGTIKCFTIGD